MLKFLPCMMKKQMASWLVSQEDSQTDRRTHIIRQILKWIKHFLAVVDSTGPTIFKLEFVSPDGLENHSDVVNAEDTMNEEVSENDH